MTTQRECCNYCMWFGPVNKDGNMRKHRPAEAEDRYGHKIQAAWMDHCPGSHKPYATFGGQTVRDPRATAKAEPQETPVTVTAAPRFVVNQLGFNNFVVRDTVTELDAFGSGSRSGAQHIADCLTDGTMAIDSLGRAVAAQAPVAPTVLDSGDFGVFDEDGECIDGPYYRRSEAEKQAQTYRADDEDGEYTVREMCPDHECHAKDNCDECFGEGEQG